MANWKMRCVENYWYSSYTKGKIYEVKDNKFKDDYGYECSGECLINFDKWKRCSNAKWELIEYNVKVEGDKMCSNGKLNKGINSKSVQDVYRSVQDNKGNIIFNKINMVNVCFVKFDDSEKVYMFNNASDKRLEAGTKVLVDTEYGEKDAIVVSSIKIQNKYLKLLQDAMCGKRLQLKNVLGVYKTKTVEVDELIKVGEDDE